VEAEIFNRFPLSSMVSSITFAVRIWDAPSFPSFVYHLLLLTEMAFLAGTILLTALAFSRSSAASEIKFAWLIYLVVAAFFSNLIWMEDWGFMRACQELLVLSLIILMGASERRWLRIAAGSTLAIWIPLALRAVLIQ
jgi:hypothetical protein